MKGLGLVGQVFVTLAALTLTLGVQLPAGAQTYLAGIDVSHWQGTIDWSAVAKDPQGIKFAIIKATEGQTVTDSSYATNKANAHAAGIKTGAYHFADPDTSANDAKLEADHFISVAHLSAGDLVPALDLEATGNLDPKTLIAWTQQWLSEIVTVTGVKPMIYSNPSFWQNSMSNTTQFADEGFVLWLAHWTSNSQPTVPANNWGGHGWTFWQWTDNDSVSGISGRVDADRYGATDFTRVTIPAMVQYLAPSWLPQGAVNAPVVITGSGFRPGVTVSFSGTGITVNSSTFASATSLNLNITVDPKAQLGGRGVTATNPDGTTGTCGACFTVTLPNNGVTTGAFGASGSNTWDVVNRNQNGIPPSQHIRFPYGRATDKPIVGDWNGDGIQTVGVVRGSTWYLRNSNSTGSADIVFSYGRSTDIPIAGDWDGNGTWTPGVIRGNTWYLRNSNTSGPADIVFSYGRSTDTPIVGDWDGNKTFTPGVVRGNTWYVRNGNGSGPADNVFSFGRSTDLPFAGDWDGNGTWTPGVLRPSTGTWYLRNAATSSAADLSFAVQAQGGDLVGNWDGQNPP